MTTTNWQRLCSTKDLNLSKTLITGQSFRWCLIGNEYCSTALQDIIILRENNNEVLYKSVLKDRPNLKSYLEQYFQLKVDMHALYACWSRDANFKAKTNRQYSGLRLMDQDITETIFQFICSANNNIKRIGSMVDKLCSNFGTLIGEYEGKVFYSFPEPEQLLKAENLEGTLRELGFGYRAKYISNTAQFLKEKDSNWTASLRSMGYEEAKTELLNLSGVGPKVADCILLFSCQKTRAIPVDVHVWNIAKRDYKMKIGEKLNSKVYKQIGDGFYEIFGEYCGWAHTLLFVADLGQSTPLKENTRNVDENQPKKKSKINK